MGYFLIKERIIATDHKYRVLLYRNIKNLLLRYFSYLGYQTFVVRMGIAMGPNILFY